jgi:hypothetical protein
VRLFVFGDACVRAGVLAWGVKGTNVCPAGSYVIVDEAQCQAAAATAGKGWKDSSSHATWARGCIVSFEREVWLNPHPTGAADSSDQPLCAVGAAGARDCVRVMDARTLRRTHAETHARTLSC